MSALPLPETEQRTATRSDAFFEAIGRQAQTLLSPAMASEQRQAAIKSTASFLHDIDALLERVRIVEDNGRQVEEQAAQGSLIKSASHWPSYASRAFRIPGKRHR